MRTENTHTLTHNAHAVHTHTHTHTHSHSHNAHTHTHTPDLGEAAEVGAVDIELVGLGQLKLVGVCDGVL